jgi:alkaline phosphatase D
VAKTPAPTNIFTYRDTYAEQMLDPALQAAHTMHPWEVIPDDHEVYNNFEGEAGQSRQAAAALSAYWEHMPLRPSAAPTWEGGAPNLTLYRYIDYGDLARFVMLDTHQYRGEPPDPETDGYLEEQYAFAPNMGDQTIGHEQEE